VGGDGGTEANLNGGKKPGAPEKEEKATLAEWIPQEARDHIGDEVTQIDPRAASTRRNREFAQAPANEKRNRMVLKYTTQDGSRVWLSGINENQDSIHVVLDRVDREYALTESKLSAGQYD